MEKTILVTGAGGFIGGHLVARLRSLGHKKIRAVDIKPLEEWYQRFDDVENVVADLRLRDACFDACKGTGDVYNLAADMGGMGFIENNKTACMLSVLINTHLLMAAQVYCNYRMKPLFVPASGLPTVIYVRLLKQKGQLEYQP